MNIRTIDLHFRGQPQVIAAFLIENNGENALVETGPASTHHALLKGLREWGVQPTDISKVLLTHIHLDHAGGAGWWAQQGAQLYVHARGARHLADPSRLIAGARLVYGDLMDELWGEIPPAPEEQIVSLADGDRLKIGGAEVQVWDTPGHARHHVAFLMEGIAFVGDDAGVRLPGQTYISPTTAPSQFEPDAYKETIRSLRNANLDAMYLTHFGRFEDVDNHLERYEQIIGQVSDLVREKLQSGAPLEAIQSAFADLNHARFDGENEPDSWKAYEAANPLNMCCDGVVQYWEKQENSAG